MPLVVGLSGITAGLVTAGYVLEREKQKALRPKSQLEQVLVDDVVMFGTTGCHFCRVAQQVFDREGIDVTAVYLDRPNHYKHLDMAELFGQLIARTQCNTVPQIFLKGEFIGGSVELQALRDNGKLQRFKS